MYSTSEVKKEHKWVKQLTHKEKVRIGGFTILPLSVAHGDVECFAFLIFTPCGQTIAFATDCEGFGYKFKNQIHHIFVEANNDFDVMVDNACEGYNNSSQSQNHMSIDNAIAFIRANYSATLQSVTLIHLSDTNSNEKEFVKRVKDEFGFDNVTAATSGQTIILEKEEF